MLGVTIVGRDDDRTARGILRSVVNTVVMLVVVLLLWQAVVSFSGISSYVGKGPVDVWRFLLGADGRGREQQGPKGRHQHPGQGLVADDGDTVALPQYDAVHAR